MCSMGSCNAGSCSCVIAVQGRQELTRKETLHFLPKGLRQFVVSTPHTEATHRACFCMNSITLCTCAYQTMYLFTLVLCAMLRAYIMACSLPRLAA